MPKKPDAEKRLEGEKASSEKALENRAVFTLLDNKYVVVQFINAKGNVVRQVPPKEVIAAAERIQESVKNLFDKEA